MLEEKKESEEFKSEESEERKSIESEKKKEDGRESPDRSYQDYNDQCRVKVDRVPAENNFNDQIEKGGGNESVNEK